MKTQLRFLILSLLVATAGCHSLPVPTESKWIQSPVLQDTTTVLIGQVVASKRFVNEKEAIVLSDRLEATTSMGNQIVVEPGYLIAERQDKFGTFYSSSKPISWAGIKGFGGIVVPHSTTARAFVFVQIGYEGHKARLDLSRRFTKTKVQEPVVGAESCELIYNGRAGTSAKFILRKAASQSLQSKETIFSHDLAKAKELEIEGLRLLIVDATETHVSCRILAPFR